MKKIELHEKWRSLRKRLSTTVLLLWIVALALSPKLAPLQVSAHESSVVLADEGPMPDIDGAVGWLNSAHLNAKSLRGKVVLVNFWTYSCINSLRELPYVASWAAEYQHSGLVVIGVHAPEFGFEKELPNVANAVRELRISFPVAIDSNHAVWQAFQNQYWPADYLIDGKGRIRYRHFGEGDCGESEHAIQTLLKENGADPTSWKPVSISGDGIEAPQSEDNRSPETYVGYGRAERFASPQRLDVRSRQTYSRPAILTLNQWALAGLWSVGAERASLQAAPGRIAFRFHARDLHMVLSPSRNPVRFLVKLDGTAPGADCGVDSASDGSGVIREPRLYQLVRRKGVIRDGTFEIDFLDRGVQAFSFTFG